MAGNEIIKHSRKAYSIVKRIGELNDRYDRYNQQMQ